MNNINTRLTWLDAMRGFTMILVVAYHVAQISFGESEKTSTSLPFLVLMRMPLFFFVSGFLAYKSRWEWTASNFASITWKKVKVQVIPALVFLCAYLVLRGHLPFWDGFAKVMQSPTKGGYWFTWVLLQMFLMYYVVAAIAQRWMRDSHVPVIILWVVAMMAYDSLYLPDTLGKWWKTDFMMQSSMYETLQYFHFFLVGNIVHRYWDRAQRLMDSKWLFVMLVVLAFVCCADIFKWHFLKGELTNLPRTVAMYSLMLIVLMTFRHYGEYMTKERVIGRGLQYIGVRTLDIYLLHFILLPVLPEVGKWLDAHHPNFCVDVVLSVGVALVVIAFCCIVSNVLRVSPVLREYLFGRK